MIEHPTPRLVVSKCLEFEHCRYNEQVIHSSVVKHLADHVDFQKVCPEVAIGLGVPRKPIRIIIEEGAHLIQPSTGKEFTKEMQEFSTSYLNSIEGIDGAILKGMSPSCGPRLVKQYHGHKQGVPVSRGKGMFAEKFCEHFPLAIVEDEGRLLNKELREHFFTYIYASARFRQVKTAEELQKFHMQHKMLLLAYDEKTLREVGPKVAEGMNTVDYGKAFFKAISSPPKYTKIINVLMHTLGKFEVSPQEKTDFLDTIEEYRDERIPLSVLIHMINNWAVRFNNDYVKEQAFFNPFPRELITLSDSGKGRK